MGKKKKAELDRQKERFINGAIKKDNKDKKFRFTKIEPLLNMDLIKVMLYYALIAYQTAYLNIL